MTSLQIPATLPTLSRFSAEPRIKIRRKIGFLRGNDCSMKCSIERWSFVEVGFEKDGILMRKGNRRGSLVVVRANQGFGFGGGGGGGGGGDEGSTSRALGNLALAVGLTYLSMTGQLGWILDAIVSIWLLAVLLPIVGLRVFFWYAGRDIVQSSCPNCGNDFQILKSSLKGVQLCPFCTQPFSGAYLVLMSGRKQIHKRISEVLFWTVKNIKTSPNGFSRRSNKGKASSAAIVDIEAEVKDIE